MTRSKYEFHTEWSFYPDDPQDAGERTPVEKKTKDLPAKTDEPRLEPRVLAAGASGPVTR